jgi:hypothetical protein
MGSSSSDQFLHRANSDGTYDSVCLVCAVAAVRAAKCESELDKADEDHRCEPWMLEPFCSAREREALKPEKQRTTATCPPGIEEI